MYQVPHWVKLAFIATALCMWAALVSAADAQSVSEYAVQHPDEVCVSTMMPDDMSRCYLEYLAELEYYRESDPTRAALTSAFPVLAVVFMAFLGLKFAGI